MEKIVMNVGFYVVVVGGGGRFWVEEGGKKDVGGEVV